MSTSTGPGRPEFAITNASRTVREAFVIANSGRPGPVLVDITKDAQQASAEFNWDTSTPQLPPKRQRVNYEKADFDRAVELLNSAKRPLILAGHGIMVSGAMRVFDQFVRTGNFPVAMTLLGIGCFPASDPLNLGSVSLFLVVVALLASYLPARQATKVDPLNSLRQQ